MHKFIIMAACLVALAVAGGAGLADAETSGQGTDEAEGAEKTAPPVRHWSQETQPLPPPESAPPPPMPAGPTMGSPRPFLFDRSMTRLRNPAFTGPLPGEEAEFFERKFEETRQALDREKAAHTRTRSHLQAAEQRRADYQRRLEIYRGDPGRTDLARLRSLERQNEHLREAVSALRAERDLWRQRFRAGAADAAVPESQQAQAERARRASDARAEAAIAHRTAYLSETVAALRNERALWRERYRALRADVTMVASERAHEQPADAARMEQVIDDLRGTINELHKERAALQAQLSDAQVTAHLNDHLFDALAALRAERDLWRDRYRAAQAGAP